MKIYHAIKIFHLCCFLELVLRRFSARVPEDFDDTTVEVTFSPTDTTANGTIPIYDNDIVDDERSFEVMIKLIDTIATVDPDRSQAVVIIYNDDGVIKLNLYRSLDP